MAAPASPIAFFTRHSEAELVVPAKPTPHETKMLSDIDDQEGLRFQLPFIMFYRNNPLMEAKVDPALLIKKALGEALVYYYPLAGRLREGPNRKLMVDCNEEGILFVEADAAISLVELGHTILPPCPHLKHFLHHPPASQSILASPLLFVQVTRLACGGFVLAIRLNHTICDTLGLLQFLNTVSQIARSAPISQYPVWQRQLFSARNPPRITCVHPEYNQPTSYSNTDNMDYDSPQMLHRSFIFTPKHILSIRNQLPLPLRNCSTFELLVACLWKCRTRALNLDPNDIVSVSPFITARGKRGLHVPNGYYGNAFAFPTAESDAGSVCEKPMEYALELIRKAKGEMSEEYVRSLADLTVVKGRPKARRNGIYMVADMSRVGFESLNFGWGEAVYGGVVGTIPYLNVSYLNRVNWNGEEGIVVPIMLPRPAMNTFFSELLNITSHHNHSYQGFRSML